ncbi:hypothetical protein SprV_0200946600 [Sparganum proliferum]
MPALNSFRVDIASRIASDVYTVADAMKRVVDRSQFSSTSFLAMSNKLFVTNDWKPLYSPSRKSQGNQRTNRLRDRAPVVADLGVGCGWLTAATKPQLVIPVSLVIVGPDVAVTADRELPSPGVSISSKHSPSGYLARSMCSLKEPQVQVLRLYRYLRVLTSSTASRGVDPYIHQVDICTSLDRWTASGGAFFLPSEVEVLKCVSVAKGVVLLGFLFCKQAYVEIRLEIRKFQLQCFIWQGAAGSPFFQLFTGCKSETITKSPQICPIIPYSPTSQGNYSSKKSVTNPFPTSGNTPQAPGAEITSGVRIRQKKRLKFHFTLGGSVPIAVTPTTTVSASSDTRLPRLLPIRPNSGSIYFLFRVILFVLCYLPLQTAGLGLGLGGSSSQRASAAKEASQLSSSWQASPFYDAARERVAKAEAGIFLQNQRRGSPEDHVDDRSSDLRNSRQPPAPQESSNQFHDMQPTPASEKRPQYVQSQDANPQWAPAPRPLQSNAYISPSQPDPRYYSPSQNYYSYLPQEAPGAVWLYPDHYLYRPYPAYHPWYAPSVSKPANERRKGKKRRQNNNCPRICETCGRRQGARKNPTNDPVIDTERAALQRRFSNHLKPAVHHAEPVRALFSYMDGNGDGVISFQELQNYLLLHNIISPDLPDADRN